MENRHQYNHREASLETSLEAFHSTIKFPLFEYGSNSISLSWIQNCFDYLFHSKKAFELLVLEIDHPMSKWEIPLIEEYLNYSLRLLDLLNLVKSSIYHVCQTRISMTLSLIQRSDPCFIQRLRSIEFKSFEINLKLEDDVKERKLSGKDLVIHEALMEMEKNGGLVIGIILSSLSGEAKPYLELKKSEETPKNFEGFIDKNVVLNEFKDISEAKDCLISNMETKKIRDNGEEDVKKLEIKLEELQKQLDDIGNKADALFSETLAGRNEVLDVLRNRN